MPTEAGLAATIAACLWIAGDVARATSPRGRRLPVLLLSLSVAAWAFGELQVWRATTPEGVRLARLVLYAGTSTLPVAWIWSAADAAQLPRLRATPLRVALLWAPLLAAYAVLWLDPQGRLIHPSARPPVFGPLFGLYVGYACLLVVAGAIGFIATARRLRKADPARVAAISLGVCVPVVGNLLFLAGGGTAIDSTPILVGVSVLVVRLFVFDAGLAAFLPVARRDVIDHLESGVLVADLHGIVVDANTAAQRLTGGAPLVGRALDEVTREATRDSTRTIEVRTTPVLGRPGVVGAFALLIDRTESQRLERQLQLAQKLEAVGVLTAGIAHEVNNPLAFVRANLGALQDLAQAVRDPDLRPSLPPKLDALLEEAPELIADSIEGVERIGRLVQRLRRFAHAGGEEPELVPVDLSTVAARARALAGVGLADEAIRCVGGGAPLVLASEDELVQIAVNLLVNALQASDGRPELELEVGAARGGARLTVRDRGTGIPASALPKLFDPFFTTKPPGQGTGLGLSLSFDLARRFGGSLEARNRPGGGAEFELWLPGAPGSA